MKAYAGLARVESCWDKAIAAFSLLMNLQLVSSKKADFTTFMHPLVQASP